MAKISRRDEFLRLLDEHKGILFKVASAYCRNALDREDLIQEIVLAVWSSFGRYDHTRRFSTWMYRIAINVAISFCRREARRPRRHGLLTGPSAEQAILKVVADAPESAELESELGVLKECISQLDELDRALVILYLDGNRYETIAEILGISETNVGTKISRIKERIRRDWPDRQKRESATWNSMN